VGIGIYDVLFHYVGQGVQWVEFNDFLLIEQADHSHHRAMSLRMNGTKFLLIQNTFMAYKRNALPFLSTTKNCFTKDPIVNCSLFPLAEPYYTKMNKDRLQREYGVGPSLQYSYLPTH